MSAVQLFSGAAFISAEFTDIYFEVKAVVCLNFYAFREVFRRIKTPFTIFRLTNRLFQSNFIIRPVICFCFFRLLKNKGQMYCCQTPRHIAKFGTLILIKSSIINRTTRGDDYYGLPFTYLLL